MAERTSVAPETSSAPTKRSRRAILLAPLVFFVGAGGGFVAFSQIVRPLLSDHGTAEVGQPSLSKDIAFIPLEPILINLGGTESGRYLRFQAQIEVTEAAVAEVSKLVPRLMDVLNGYLRAVDPSTLEERAALIRIKAQMLRRIQMVVGSGKVRDLLVSEFVVS